MSSLKKALEKLKPGHHGSSASDDEKSGGVKSPTSVNGRAQSPAATPRSSVTLGRSRPSGEHKRGDVASPTDSRTSIDQPRGSLSGILHRRTESPNRTGTNKSGSSHQRSGSLSTHSPMRAVKEKLHIGNDSSDEDAPLNREGEPMSRGQLRKHEKQAQQEERHKQNLEK